MTLEINLELFAETFKTEEDLRRSLATLLGKMGDNREITITHGTQEYGKDIVFYTRDGIGDWALNACVVKNTKIMGSADDKGARNVLIQVEQALDTPFLNSSGQRENVSHVFVISPYDCSQSTMHSIEGKLKERSGQVTFLCGSRLLEKFARCWPEFLVFESTLLGSYVAALQKRLDQDDPIAFLMSQHQIISAGRKTLSDVYVRQGFVKRLRRVTLLLETPSFALLRQPLQENRLNEIIESLIFASDLLSHPQSWNEGAYEIADKCAADLRKQAKDAAINWKGRLDLLHAKALERGWTPPSVKKARIRPQDIKGNRIQELEQRVAKAIDNLKVCIDRANEFASSRASMPEMLHSEEHLNYCRIHELVRAFPQGFRVDRASIFSQNLSENLLEEVSGSLLITAPAGLGKTSFCKWNTLFDLNELTQKRSETIPIYVALHQLSTTTITNYQDVFLRTSELQALFENAKRSKRHVRIYLDGLDEVTTGEQQNKLMLLASSMAAGYPELQVIVTGRDYVSCPGLRWLPRISLAKFNNAQVSELIEKWLGKNSDVLADFQVQLSNVEALDPLMRIPLLATLIIAVYKRMRSLPENKVKLYEIFVELMCGGWDLAKNVRRDSKFGSNLKLSILTRLAGVLQNAEKREARDADFEAAVRNTVFVLTEKWNSLLAELLEDGLLVRTTYGVAFSHLSFQEFLAAKDLADPAGGRAQPILQAFLSGDDRWREVLSFYVGMSNKPDAMASWIRNNTGAQISERATFLLKRIAESSSAWIFSEDVLNSRPMI